MIGRVTYGHITGISCYMNTWIFDSLNNRDRQTIAQAVNNHIEMLKVTKRFMS